MNNKTSLLSIEHSLWKRYVPNFLLGAIMVFSYAPFSLWFVSIAALSIWIYLLNEQDKKQAFRSAFAFGLGFFGVGISWVHVSIEQFGGLPLIVSILLMVLLCAYLALFTGLAAYLAARFNQNKVSLVYLPFTWLIAETLRGVVLTGFSWLSIGYSQIDGPFAALAPIIGEIGISFIVILIACLLVSIVNKQRLKLNSAILASVVIVTIIASQLSFVEKTGKVINTALVQGNIKQELRWDKQAEQNIIDLYIDQTTELYKNNDLIIWPEAAIPRLEPLSQDILSKLNHEAAQANTALITGIINYEPDSSAFFNRLIVLGNKNVDDNEGDYYWRNSNHYDKHHLLPIGEFIPFQELLRPIAPLFNLPMSSFSRGDYVQKNLIANGIQIAPLICFEVVFSKQLAANFDNDTEILLTVSNDAWFGASHGPDQHLEIARMRALEYARPMLRATNNGLTAVIDHNGRISADIEQFTLSTLQTKVDVVTGTTFYSDYGIHLDKLLFVVFALMLIIRRYRN
ncbi:apolipoprotein N-acyltransferase [Thalassotalea crassostreae]|uniref:apolipoprotein N-acyltransferase n=1 Tax=Thalassotalea crassostreae TaxID=1763536 RepID=UPI0008383182|nr:apolipoprotein N-acyltransferase [Thalassotalea crassostreae]